MLETLVAITVITIGLLSLLVVIPATMNVSRMSRESQIATTAVRSQLDDMRSAPFPDVTNRTGQNIFTLYENATFTAVGLMNAQGKVTFLGEVEASALFGAPLDLNADGVTSTAVTVTAEYTAYPVRIDLRWTDPLKAPRNVSLTTIIYNINK